MDFLVLTLTLALSYAVYYLYNFHKTKSKYAEHGIPFIQPLPFFGNLLQVVLRKKTFANVAEDAYNAFPEAKYMVTFNFERPYILIRDLDLIKSVAIKNADSFVDHRSIIEVEDDEFFGNNLFNLKGEKWHKVRTTLTPAFTSSKMKMMFEIMSENARSFTDRIAKMGEIGGKEFEMKEVFAKYGNDVIASSVFGIKIDSMKDPENEFFVLGRKSMNFEGILSLKIMLWMNLPWLMRMLNVKLFTGRIVHFFSNVINENVKVRDEKKISRPDMLDLMMKTRGTSSELTLEEMTGLAFGFFFGGFDTVVTQMSFLAHEVAVHPEIHSKLQKEIDSVWLETKGNLTYDVINKMSYLDAVVYENLRLYPPGSLSDRICKKPFVLPPAFPGKPEYTVQPEELIWIPIGPMLKDPKYFENPEEFDPERFFRNKIIPNQLPFIPFGLGPRMCIGNRFALLEMKILIVHLLLRCNLKVCSKTNVPMKFSKKNVVLSSEGGWWLKVEKRTNSPIDRLEVTL